MKRIAAMALLAVLVLGSCKREYTCECTTTDSSGQFPTQTSTTTVNATKSDAKAACESSTTSGSITVTCNLQ